MIHIPHTVTLIRSIQIAYKTRMELSSVHNESINPHGINHVNYGTMKNKKRSRFEAKNNLKMNDTIA